MKDLTIIVPAYNEGTHIRPFLRHLRAMAPSAEVIVVDGGSTDNTRSEAVADCDLLLNSPKRRPQQMNDGARAASGSILWFLHADCEIPSTAVKSILEAVRVKGHIGGCFRIRLPDPRLIFRVHDSWAHYIGRLVRVRCGDHGLFSTREAFDKTQGYPDVPLMEDADFVRALHGIGTFAWLDDRLTTSCRRHHQLGPYRYTFICAAIVALYCLGIDNETLSSWYERMIPKRHSSRTPIPLPALETTLFTQFRKDLKP